MFVYLVIVSGWEHSDVLKAFSTKELADQFVGACRDYEATKDTAVGDPPALGIWDDEQAPEFYKEWYAWNERLKTWETNHPAGGYLGADELRVDAVEVLDSLPATV